MQPRKEENQIVLIWNTDDNPVRRDQIELFYKWQVEKGILNNEGQPNIKIELKHESNESKLIAALSGVGADMMDCQILEYQNMGLLEDLTQYASKYEFELDKTHPSLAPHLTYENKQFGFPCNIGVQGVIINAGLLKKLNLPVPTFLWTIEEFETIGKAFVQKTKHKSFSEKEFFGPSFHILTAILFVEALYQSYGKSFLNETMTMVDIDTPEFRELLRKIYQWTHVDNIFPSKAEWNSIRSQSGYGGKTFSLFSSNKMAIMTTGRYFLIRLRKQPSKLNLAYSISPYKKYPITFLRSRSLGMYKGSKQKESVAHFFSFLASEAYNNQIVQNADGLPPLNNYLNYDRFQNPNEIIHEMPIHLGEARAAKEYGVSESNSPFVHTQNIKIAIADGISSYLLGVNDFETTIRLINKHCLETIRFNLRNNPDLQARYDDQCLLQRKINSTLHSGEVLKKEWISNPFLQHIYEIEGKLE